MRGINDHAQTHQDNKLVLTLGGNTCGSGRGSIGIPCIANRVHALIVTNLYFIHKPSWLLKWQRMWAQACWNCQWHCPEAKQGHWYWCLCNRDINSRLHQKSFFMSTARLWNALLTGSILLEGPPVECLIWWLLIYRLNVAEPERRRTDNMLYCHKLLTEVGDQPSSTK